MYLIVGLGNPEEEYAGTRHNMGVDVINKITTKHEIKVSKKKFDGLYGTGIIENQKVILLKPQTYMNQSGICVKKFVDFYKIKLDNLIIIYDDIDIEMGTVKLRKKGGAGTHNGMKSVVQYLGTTNFPRVRVGIGTPENKADLINYVIGHVSAEDKIILDKSCEIAKNAVEEYLKNGIDIAMNRFN